MDCSLSKHEGVIKASGGFTIQKYSRKKIKPVLLNREEPHNALLSGLVKC